MATTHSATLRKVGGSLMLAVPPALLKSLGLESGGQVNIALRRGQLIVEPKRRPHYRLDELLAACTPPSRRPQEEREWISGKAAGRELI